MPLHPAQRGEGDLARGGAVAERGPAQGSAALAGASVSSGLVFGLCEQGGLTNCVASGDSFYPVMKTGIDSAQSASRKQASSSAPPAKRWRNGA